MLVLFYVLGFIAVVFWGAKKALEISDKRWEKTSAEVVADPGLVENVFLLMPKPMKQANLQMRLTDGRLLYVESGVKAVRLFDAWRRGEKNTVFEYISEKHQCPGGIDHLNPSH